MVYFMKTSNETEQTTYKVEKVLGKKTVKGTKFVLVKYKGGLINLMSGYLLKTWLINKAYPTLRRLKRIYSDSLMSIY